MLEISMPFRGVRIATRFRTAWKDSGLVNQQKSAKIAHPIQRRLGSFAQFLRDQRRIAPVRGRTIWPTPNPVKFILKFALYLQRHAVVIYSSAG
ncbi:MAG: hypothetical protein DCC66_00795 [Planctomycetota bacterium]|nr:MAG: hypothetical protein DCC66_00795 [Planctomycetota bacterium]